MYPLIVGSRKSFLTAADKTEPEEKVDCVPIFRLYLTVGMTICVLLLSKNTLSYIEKMVYITSEYIYRLPVKARREQGKAKENGYEA